jgi:hypothetical protein
MRFAAGPIHFGAIITPTLALADRFLRARLACPASKASAARNVEIE